MKNLSFQRNPVSPVPVRKETAAASVRQPNDARTADADKIDTAANSRLSEKDIKDAEWAVSYYQDKLIYASSSEKVMYHKLLKEKEAHLNSLKAQYYSTGYSTPSSATASSSHSGTSKAIKDAEWDVKYYTDKLIGASSHDKVLYHKLLKESQAKLDALKASTYSSAPAYPASTHASSAHTTSTHKAPAYQTSTYQTPTYKPAGSYSSSSHYASSSSSPKVSQADIDKAKDDVAHYTKKLNETKVSQADINQAKDDVNHYAMKVSQTKVSPDELDNAKKDIVFYQEKCRTTRVSQSELEKAEDDVDYYARKCNNTRVSEAAIEKAEDDLDYFQRKCHRYPQHSPQYAEAYDQYLDAKDYLAVLKNKKSAYASHYANYAKSKDHLDNLKSDQAAYTQYAEKLANSQQTLSALEHKQAAHLDYANKLAASQKKLAGLESKQDDHKKFADKLAKSQKTLADLEQQKAASAPGKSTAPTAAYGNQTVSASSAAQGKKPNAEMEKVISDMEFYKQKYIGTTKGSADEKYYMEKYMESSAKLDELKKKDDADFYASLKPSGKVTQTDVDNAKKELHYFKEKLHKAASGTPEYDFYLDQSAKAKLKLNALNDQLSHPTVSTSVSSGHKPTTSTPVSTPLPAYKNSSVATPSISKPAATQSEINAAKADMEYWQGKWYADTKDDDLWDKYWASKKKLEKLENPAQIISANEVNATTPSHQAPVPQSKIPMDAQAQIDALKQHHNTYGFNSTQEHQAYKTKLDLLEKQKDYENKLAGMEADTGDYTPASGHNHLKADYVISSHGSYKACDGWVDLPPGIFIRTNAKHGSPINNGLGWALEEDRASLYRFSELWTNKIRNYTITKEPDFENNTNAKITQVPIPLKEQHILDIVGPYAPSAFDPKQDKPIIFDAAFCLADSTSDNYDYTFGPDGPYKK